MKKKSKLKLLAASDLHGNSAVAESLAKKAEKEKVDLVILAGDLNGFDGFYGVIYPFKKRNQKVIFIPGNWDSSLDATSISEIYEIKNFDGKYVHYDGVDILGIGSADWKMKLNPEKTLDKVSKSLEKLKERNNQKIFVSHLHAAGTIGEFSGIPGDKTIRKIIEYLEPDIFIAGHIHEAEGLEQKIGKTQVFHVGKKGKIIRLG